MYKESRLMFVYAVTPVHMGAGQGLGVIDNPIQRERHTEHPNMAGSGLKGAIRHHLYNSWEESELNRIFGPSSKSANEEAGAGAISFGDAQLVSFPVRSLKRSFLYAVSPTTLARLKRVSEMTGGKAEWSVPQVKSERCLVSSDGALSDGKLVLEMFDYPAEVSEELKRIAVWIAEKMLPEEDAHAYFREKLASDLVLLPDQEFTYFTKNATLVEPHVRIGEETGVAAERDLFFTENLPPESLMVAPLFASDERYKKRSDDHWGASEIIKRVEEALNSQMIQVGGDATIGRGQVVLSFDGGMKDVHGE